MRRRTLFKQIATVCVAGLQVGGCNAFMPFDKPTTAAARNDVAVNGAGTSDAKVAYKSLSLDIDDYGVTVPVAMWFPLGKTSEQDQVVKSLPRQVSGLSYQHRISVSRIGQLLAGWDFIPPFAKKDFELTPTLPFGSVVSGETLTMPTQGPVVYLAHGYLGSRFDLSHLAEELAKQGFICLSPEYPESLAASYPRMEGLDRSRITRQLTETMRSEWKIDPSAMGIVGHSMGCGTAISTGDADWARVCIAGFTRTYDGSPVPGNALFVSSMNDGTMSFNRFGGKDAIPSDVVQLDEAKLSELTKVPSRSTVVFDSPDAPNHISFLCEGVNDAMIDLLSPLLPVAEAMNIPVLDFDKYKISRDSKPTADIVVPLVCTYLKQQMLKTS